MNERGCALFHEWSSPRGDPAGREERYCYGPRCPARQRRWRGGRWESDRSPQNHGAIREQAERLHGACA